jgi:hypothetical protein
MKFSKLKKIQHAKANLVAKSIAKHELATQFRRIRTKVFALSKGDDASDLLSALGWLVGVGSEISHATAPGSPTARRLHGAVRQIVQMSAAGGRWQIAMAAPFYDAAVDSHELLLKHPSIACAMSPGAANLSALIAKGHATLDMVVGPELYQSPTTGAQA